MKQLTLPNGLPVHALNQLETDALYHEIFDMKAYGQHGIRLADDACVFDVGANIGLYSLFLSQSYRDLKLFAFEPIPALFDALRGNAQRYYPQARLLNVGLSSHAHSAPFTFKPALSMMTTMYPKAVADSVQKQAGSYVWMRAILADMECTRQLPARLSRLLRQWLEYPFVRVPVLGVALLPLLYLSFKNWLTTKQITCSLQTLSQIILEHNIPHIDLVKIDVEGSEWDVLQGIEARDWPKINQFVIEVHNIDNRVNKLVELLRQHGYQTTLEQQDLEILKLMNVYSVFAQRPQSVASRNQ